MVFERKKRKQLPYLRHDFLFGNLRLLEGVCLFWEKYFDIKAAHYIHIYIYCMKWLTFDRDLALITDMETPVDKRVSGIFRLHDCCVAERGLWAGIKYYCLTA